VKKMVAPIIAAAAPAVVQSATDDEGLINKLFKIAMLIGFLALAAISIIILSIVMDIGDVAASGFNLISVTARAFTILPGPIGILATGATALLSAFGFGGRR
jgi:hypothetical protein